MNSHVQESYCVVPARIDRIFDRFDVLCVIALVLCFIVTSQLSFGASKFSDMYFHAEAKALSQAVRGYGSWKDVSFARAPGPVLYYGVPYTLVQPDSGDDAYWRAGFAWNAFWMLCALLLIRRTAELFWNATAGKIAVLLFLLTPFAVYYSFGISGETPAYVAAILFLFGWAKYRANPAGENRLTAVTIALIGLIGMLLCRPNAALVLGFAGGCAGALWVQRRVRDFADAKFAAICLIVASAAMLLVAGSLRYLTGGNRVTSQASNFSDVAFFGSFQFRTEPWDWRFWGKATRDGSVDYQNWVQTRSELEIQAAKQGVALSTLELRWTLRDMIQHPVLRAKMVAVRILALNIWLENSKKAAKFAVGPLRGLFGYVLFHMLLNALVFLTLVGSIWLLVHYRGDITAYWPLWAPWLGLLLFHALTYAEPRYMLPGVPGLTVMAACALAGRRFDSLSRPVA